MAELADFEPSDGHRHDCPRRDAPPFAAMPQVNLSACDCAAQLYEIAAQAEEALAHRSHDAVALVNARGVIDAYSAHHEKFHPTCNISGPPAPPRPAGHRPHA